MPYTKTAWQNEPSVTTAISAANLNNLETQYDSAMGDFGPRLGYLNVRDYGAVGDGVADDTAAIQSALNAGVSSGQAVLAAGTFLITSTITIACNVEFTNAIFQYSGTGTAVVVGSLTTPLQRRRILLPEIIATAKTTTGWTQVAGSIGVDAQNAYACTISVPHIESFATGIRIYGANNHGSSYSTFYIDHLDNNMVNMLLDGDSSTLGYSNSNLFISGRYSHNSNEGTAVAGVSHVTINDLTGVGDPNNNTWLNPSFESAGTEQYVINSLGGMYNTWINPRLENSAGTSTIHWGATTQLNTIITGYALNNIVEVWDSGATRNMLIGGSWQRMMGSGTAGGLLLENTSSSLDPALSVLAAGGLESGAAVATAYMAQLRGSTLALKNATDTYDRVLINGTTGQILFGQSTSAATAGFQGNGSAVFVVAGATLLGFLTDNTADIGQAANYRPRYIRAGTAVQTGSAVTASRPAAATAGVGAMFYDTTLGKPIWSTGSAWHDATGTAV